MTGPRYARDGDEVVLRVTSQQASVLSYVLRRAQEDPHFFDVMVGDADHRVTNRFRLTLAQLVTITNSDD